MSYDLAAYKAALPMLDAYAEWKRLNNSALQYGRLWHFDSAGYRKRIGLSNTSWKVFMRAWKKHVKLGDKK